MPTAYLTTQRLKVSLSSKRLEITVPAEAEGNYPERRSIPLRDIEHVVIDSGISISTPALSELLQNGIPVLILSHGNFPSGVATPLNHSTTFLAAQIDRTRDIEYRLHQSRSLVYQKIMNQRRVIQRLSANRSIPPSSVSWLKAIAVQSSAAGSLDSLRGLEGAASGRYFEELAQFFPENLPFVRRTRRPPLNEANALLSFLYTLLISEIAMHLRAHGIEPGWGVYHEAEDHRPALALDLVEPYRAPIADALAMDLINHRRLTSTDFEYEGQGCLLKRESRRIVFAALENRLERQFKHEQSGHRTTLRQLFKDACLGFKKSILEGSPIEPFQMN